MSKKHGNVRIWFEQLKVLARASGLTLEQMCDVFDSFAALQDHPPSSTDDARVTSPEPKGVQ